MKILSVVILSCLVVAIAAKKGHKEEAESRSHVAKKYAEEHQRPEHFDHKKHGAAEEEQLTDPKQAPVDVPELEAELQANLETSGKRAKERRHREQAKDLHLQDLAYEETLQKEKRHHHRQEADKEKVEKKLFVDQGAEPPVAEKVIEDSFEPLEPGPVEGGKAKRQHKEDKKQHKEDKKQHKEDKKQQKEEKRQHKDKSKSKKAYEKGKDKNGKKQKEGKKGKDKKHQKH